VATLEIEEQKQHSQESKLSTDVTYAERIAILSRKERKLQEELRTLRSTEAIKTKRIATLEGIHEDVQEMEMSLNTLKQEKRVRETKIVDLQKKLVHARNELKQRDLQLERITDKNRGVPMNIWLRDRDMLQSKVKQLKIALENKERTVEAQRQRIVELCDRVDLIASSLQDSDPELAKQSQLAAQINGTFSSLSSSQRRRPTGQAPLLETSLRSDKLDSDLVFLDDDGEEAELTDDLFDFTEVNSSLPQIELPAGAELIPARLYEVLEAEVQKLRVQSAHQEELLQEKDDIIRVR
jgi:hypothetical protein